MRSSCGSDDGDRCSQRCARKQLLETITTTPSTAPRSAMTSPDWMETTPSLPAMVLTLSMAARAMTALVAAAAMTSSPAAQAKTASMAEAARATLRSSQDAGRLPTSGNSAANLLLTPQWRDGPADQHRDCQIPWPGGRHHQFQQLRILRARCGVRSRAWR